MVLAEKDDDSPYFVKIILDQMFLSYLEEPSVVDPTEIAENTQTIVDNKVFTEIIQKEVFSMFYRSK